MTTWIWGVLAFIFINLSLNLQHSAIFERPIESTVVLLFCSSISLFSACAAKKQIFSTSRLCRDDEAALSQGIPASVQSDGSRTTNAARRRLFIILVLLICFRVHLIRGLVNNRQCIAIGNEGFLPLLLAVHDYWYKKRRKAGDQVSPRDPIHETLFERVFHGDLRYVLPAALLSLIYASTTALASSPRSTYICTASNTDKLVVPIAQVLGLLIDAFILTSLSNHLAFGESWGGTSNAYSPVYAAFVLLASAVLVASGGSIAFVTHPREWLWVLAPGSAYWTSLAFWTLSMMIAIPLAIQVAAIYGPLHLTMCLYNSISYASLLSLVQWTAKSPTLVPEVSRVITRLVVLTLSFILYLQALSSKSSSNPSGPRIRFHGRIPLATIAIVLVFFWSWSFLRFPQDTGSRVHPIDSLLSAASVQHDGWLQQASASKTLDEAVKEYIRRYKRQPPPEFDTWHAYAMERSSIVVDDFDNLMNDLQLFWAIKPSEIRRRTREALSDPWNEVAEIRIRSGKAEIGPDVKPTHRWMLDGVIAMMKNYIEKIPDMDLGFNINDEPRIAIPYNDLQSLHKDSSPSQMPKQTPLNKFSNDRAPGWNLSNPSDPTSTPNRPFTDYSFQPTFHTHGSISCLPSSVARGSHLWDVLPLCKSCLAPHSHSTGLFVSNWSLSASPCHQPDLAHLHGFYLSPAAFKPSRVLYPIFSQSKAEGYADIRYPSPWNYMDKAVYAPSDTFKDPAFGEKEDTLFWRGATSEGLSRYGEWKGMARQRLVHLANNASSSTGLPILLPSFPNTSPNARYQPTYTTHSIPPSLLPELGLNVSDIHLVSKIDRCWDADCPTQARELGLSPPSDFQSHWRYKYLIDLDGAGFSGRFIPFLQSRSLPFKVAGVFREWWDGRVTAWKHFVPIDIRLHALHSTLAYFHGNRAVEKRGMRVVEMKGRTEEGQRIAESGREWVGKVMRKEDMEIYFYRLLLEWGRLTDDARDELGFRYEE